MKLYNDDCLNVLRSMDSETVDCVVTDCPYHIVQGGCTTNTKSDGIFNRDFAKNGKLFGHNDIKFSEWLPEVYRVLKQNTHCYIMINPRNLKDLQAEAEKTGFIFQNLLVWEKGNYTPNRYYMNAYELVLMLRKGAARNINNMATSNILRVQNIVGNKKHPTEKPAELMKILISNSTESNDLVLDPFMGSGSTGVACNELKRRFIGIEIDDRYFDIAKDRIFKDGSKDNTEINGQINIFDYIT